MLAPRHLLLFLTVLATAVRATDFAQAQVLTQNAQLEFGTLQLPLAGSNSFTVSYSGATSGTGLLLYGSAAAGSYKITRGSLPTGTISLDIQNINSGNPALTISNFTGQWGSTVIASFPRSGLSRPAITGTTLKLGATLTYTNAVSVGTITPSFDIVLIQP